MKLAVLLGAVVGLLLGALAVGALLATLSEREPLIPPAPTPTVAPGEFGLYTPPPSPTPTPSPSPTPSPRPGATISVGTEPGQRAPALVLPHLAGGTIDSRQVNDRPLWVNFMATWCPPCRDELPMMQGFALRLDDQIEVILVDVAEDPDTVLNFMLELGVDLPVALDEDGSTQRDWGAFALPVHFLIDEEGIVQEVVFGGAPREIYIEALQTVLPDIDPRLLDPDAEE
jgi:cytochrome c biogenesis protein CcmG, thiol:disulfide interchange protein DsbE